MTRPATACGSTGSPRRLTWQPQPVTRLSVTFTGDPSWHDAVAPGDSQCLQISVLNPDVVLGRLRDGGGSLSFSGQPRRCTRGCCSRRALSRSLFRKDRLPETDLGASTPYFLDVSSGVASGGFGGSEWFHLGRTALRLSGTRLAGPHTLKLGLEYENTALSSRVDEGRDQIGGRHLCDRPARKRVSISGTGSRISRTSPTASTPRTAEDSWAISHWLRLNAGLRWEEQDWLDQERVIRQTHCGRVVSPGGTDRHARRGGSPEDRRQRGPLLRAGASRCTLGLLWRPDSSSRTFYPQDP